MELTGVLMSGKMAKMRWAGFFLKLPYLAKPLFVWHNYINKDFQKNYHIQKIMSVLQFETTVRPDGTIMLPCTKGDAIEFLNRTVRVVIEPSPNETPSEKRPISFFLKHAAGVLDGKTLDDLESAKIESRLEKYK